MTKVNLCDEVIFTESSQQGISLAWSSPLQSPPPFHQNLVYRAALKLFQEEHFNSSFSKRGIHITIKKRIPLAAGLGGGSSNAASVLIALPQFAHCPVRKQRLARLARQLGADIPFFLIPDAAWASGIGDRLKICDIQPQLFFVLLELPIAVATPFVYKHLQLTHQKANVTRPPSRKTVKKIEEIVPLLHNDLEPVVGSFHPEIYHAKKALLERGALGAVMSGSGPTVFGLFADRKSAEEAWRRLQTEPYWKAYIVQKMGSYKDGAFSTAPGCKED